MRLSDKHLSIASLSEKCRFFCDKGQLNQALNLIHDFVERIITEPLCVSQVFGSKTLDNLCQYIGEINLGKLQAGNLADTQRTKSQNVIVYLATKLQKSGGHTKVIEDFIRVEPEGQHYILLTDLEGRSDSDYIDNVLSRQSNVAIEHAPKLNYHQRLSWLQMRLQVLLPNKVYLFNHHQDSVAVAAIQPGMNLDASFYHHGDHHLCLGVYLSHLKHIDPHPMGYYNCRQVLGIDNLYIPLTVEDKGPRPCDLPFMSEGALTTCTAARSNKIEVPYFISYLELVPKLLKTTRGKHIHIGRLTPWALCKIRRELKRYGIDPDRFIYTPWVSSVWKSLHEFRVDLYIASFPYGGGLTLIEAMGAGIPVALHRHIFSKILSGLDLAYTEAFSWRHPEELLEYCSKLTPESLQKQGYLGRRQYENYHSRRLRLIDATTDHSIPRSASDKFTVESDEWALWIERQMNIRRVISRTAYRSLRRLRAWWHRHF